MKFIFVCSSFNIGGVERCFSTLVDGVIDKDAEVELHLVDQSSEIKTYIPNRVKITYVHSNYNEIYGSGTKNGVAFLYRRYGLWSALKRIYVKLLMKFGIYKPFVLSREFFDVDKKFKCDVCVVLKENEPCLFYAINNIDARKRIAFFHTAKYLEKEYKPIYCSKIIDKIITVSKGNRDFLVANMPKAAHKIHVVHNVVPVEKIKTLVANNESLYGEDELPILFVGRICDEKGVNLIIETAVLLKEEIPNIHWYLLGPFDKEMSLKYFDELLVDKRLQEQVTKLPPTENPYPYISQAWVIVNPSRIESFGMVIREAQILEKPVIATKTYGGVELIEDGKTGLLVDIDDAHQMAEAIKRLYRETDFYKEIVKNLEHSEFDETASVRDRFNALLK